MVLHHFLDLKPVFKAHGRSDSTAVKNGILNLISFIEKDTIGNIEKIIEVKKMNEKQIHEILKEKLKVDNISNDMNLRDDFNTDSIGLLEIVMELEDAY